MHISSVGEVNIPVPFSWGAVGFDDGSIPRPLFVGRFRHMQNTTKPTMSKRAATPPPAAPAISPTFVDVVWFDELEAGWFDDWGGDGEERDAKPGFPVTLPHSTFNMSYPKLCSCGL